MESDEVWSNLSLVLVNDTEVYYQKNYKHLNISQQVFITSMYILGIVGNAAAIFILYEEKTGKFKNRKHSLMLRCMAGNDLVACLGMLVMMHCQLYLPVEISESHMFCVLRVIWRVFGLSSGCVAIVMAVERWLALTHPFVYQRFVTYSVLLKAVLCLWAGAFLLVCMPLFGFGLYYDWEKKQCARYRMAEAPIDIAYAYTYFVFGILLCIGISCANLSVTRSLVRIGQIRKKKALGRRICRTVSKNSNGNWCQIDMVSNAATPEEVAFARLMVALSISFLICWMPNMLTIPLAKLQSLQGVFRIADILMLLHFTFDPYIYVLLHHYHPCLHLIYNCCCRCCGTRRNSLERSETTRTDLLLSKKSESVSNDSVGAKNLLRNNSNNEI